MKEYLWHATALFLSRNEFFSEWKSQVNKSFNLTAI